MNTPPPSLRARFVAAIQQSHDRPPEVNSERLKLANAIRKALTDLELTIGEPAETSADIANLANAIRGTAFAEILVEYLESLVAIIHDTPSLQSDDFTPPILEEELPSFKSDIIGDAQRKFEKGELILAVVGKELTDAEVESRVTKLLTDGMCDWKDFCDDMNNRLRWYEQSREATNVTELTGPKGTEVKGDLIGISGDTLSTIDGPDNAKPKSPDAHAEMTSLALKAVVEGGLAGVLNEASKDSVGTAAAAIIHEIEKDRREARTSQEDWARRLRRGKQTINRAMKVVRESPAYKDAMGEPVLSDTTKKNRTPRKT